MIAAEKEKMLRNRVHLCQMLLLFLSNLAYFITTVYKYTNPRSPHAWVANWFMFLFTSVPFGHIMPKARKISNEINHPAQSTIWLLYWADNKLFFYWLTCKSANSVHWTPYDFNGTSDSEHLITSVFISTSSTYFNTFTESIRVFVY